MFFIIVVFFVRVVVIIIFCVVLIFGKFKYILVLINFLVVVLI